MIAYKDEPTADTAYATPVPVPAADTNKASGANAAMPSTGESTSPAMWIGSLLAVISGVALAYVVIRRRKAKE